MADKAKTAVIWSFLDVLIRQIFQLVISMVLSRLLAPEDFGTLAIVSLFISFANIFVDGGLSCAIIQKKSISEQEVSSVFWFNLGFAIFMATLLVLSSATIANYFANHQLESLTQLMAVNLILLALQSVHRAMLTREFRFKALMVASTVSIIASGTVSVFLAWRGFGVWSLVFQTLIGSAVSGAFLLYLYRIPRLFLFDFKVLRRLLQFSIWVLGASLLNSMQSSVTTVLLGKLFSLKDLGYYLRADGTKNMPLGLLSSSLERVLLPAFTQANNDSGRLAKGARRVLLMMMAINVPVMIVLAALAEPVILLLFGVKWLPVAPYLSVLCLAGSFWPLHVVNVQILLAVGRSDLFFHLDLIKAIVAVIITMAASTYGVIGLVWGQVLISAVSWIINCIYSTRYVTYGFLKQLREVIPIFLLAFLIMFLIKSIGKSVPLEPIFTLIIFIPFSVIVGFTLGILFRIPGYKDLLDILFGKIKATSLN